MSGVRGSILSSRWLIALPLVGVVAALALVLWLANPRAVASAVASARPGWLLAAVALSVLSPVIFAVKLRVLLEAVDYPVAFRRCLSAVMAAVTLNAVLPGRGGDLTRAVFLSEDRGSFTVVLGAVIVERLFDIFALGLLALILGFGIDASAAPAWIGLGVCGAALMALWLLGLGERAPVARRIAMRLGLGAYRIVRRPGRALGVATIATVGWLGVVGVMWCCFRAVRSPIPAAAVAGATPVGILAGIVPITVSGIGTRDAAMLLMLHERGAEAEIVAASFLYTAAIYGVLPLVGSLALGRETLRKVRRAVESARRSGTRMTE